MSRVGRGDTASVPGIGAAASALESRRRETDRPRAEMAQRAACSVGDAPVTISPRVQKVVLNVLLDEAKRGETTKKGATMLVMRKLEQGGGAGRFGIGPAEMIMCLEHMVSSEVSRQLKARLPDGFVDGYAWPNAPPSLISELRRLPAWIAVSEGIDARWVPSLKATAQDWQDNANLKIKKAEQTMKQADLSTDIARYLIMYGFGSLDEAM